MAEGPSCFCSRERKARKQHKCSECHGLIEPGEEYVVESGVWDGEPASYKLCPSCAGLWRSVFNERPDPEDNGGYGTLYQEVFDGDNIDWMRRWVENAQKRGGSLGKDGWMLAKYNAVLKEVLP